MNLWFKEHQTKSISLGLLVEKAVHYERTPFQELLILENQDMGRVMVLDNAIQTSIKDEFVYHEMIAHVPMNTHPNPRRVLVIGGGDGGSVREIVKHPSLEKVTLVEIDERVIAAAREYLPEISSGLDHPRVEVVIGDGNKYVREHKGVFDVIIIDSTDPVGPGEVLFSADFYAAVFDALTGDGLFVAQTESPFYNGGLIARINKDLKPIFPVTRLYLAPVPTYPGGLWSFTMGSKKYDPLDLDEGSFTRCATRYYSPAVHLASFALPPFVKEILRA